MLTAPGLAGARLFVVEERPLVDGRLPEDQVAPLRGWLHALAADQGARAAVVRQTLTGALDSLEQRVAGVAAAVEEQQAAAAALRDAAPTPPTTAARAGDRRGRAQRHAAARVRCWPAGRSSSAPGSGCGRCRGR